MSFEEALSSYVVAASVLGNLDTATVQVAEKTIRQLKAYQMGTKQEDLVIPLSGLTRSNGTLREGFRKNNILISPYVALGQKPSRENLLKRPPAIVMIPAPLSEAQRASLNELLRTEDRILEKRSKKQAVQKDEDSDSAKPSDAIEIILEFCTSTTPFIPAPHRKALEEALNALAVASDEKYKEFVRELEGDGMMGVEVVLKESVFPALRQATSVETIETLLLLEKLINILEVRKERVK